MSKKEQVEQLTDYMANFVSYIAKVLPDDIIAKLDELAEKEDSPLSKVIYETMKKNQVLAKELNRPSCQDTGVLQFWVKCGTNFPLIGELETLLKEAVIKSTVEAPLRHNSVESFCLASQILQSFVFTEGNYCFNKAVHCFGKLLTLCGRNPFYSCSALLYAEIIKH